MPLATISARMGPDAREENYSNFQPRISCLFLWLSFKRRRERLLKELCDSPNHFGAIKKILPSFRVAASNDNNNNNNNNNKSGR